MSNKIKKIDEITIEVADENGVKLWTLDTFNHTLDQIIKDRTEPTERLAYLTAQTTYFEELLRQAKELGVISPKEAQEKKEAEDINNKKEE